MKRHLLLLAGIILLYVASSLVLKGLYGDSYSFLEGNDYWRPDGKSGWVQVGEPTEPPPEQASRNIPILVLYLPFFLPAILLALFLFTPLKTKLDPPPADSPPETDSEETDTVSPDVS
jgi:hypothetical protein